MTASEPVVLDPYEADVQALLDEMAADPDPEVREDAAAIRELHAAELERERRAL